MGSLPEASPGPGSEREEAPGSWNLDSYEDEEQGACQLFRGLRFREPDTGFLQNLQSKRNLLFPSTFPSAGSGTTASLSIMLQVNRQVFTQRIPHFL